MAWWRTTEAAGSWMREKRSRWGSMRPTAQLGVWWTVSDTDQRLYGKARSYSLGLAESSTCALSRLPLRSLALKMWACPMQVMVYAAPQACVLQYSLLHDCLSISWVKCTNAHDGMDTQHFQGLKPGNCMRGYTLVRAAQQQQMELSQRPCCFTSHAVCSDMT